MTKPTLLDLSPYTVGKAIPNNESTPVPILAKLLNRPPDNHEFQRARTFEKGEYVEYVLVLNTDTSKWETHRLKKLQALLDEMSK